MKLRLLNAATAANSPPSGATAGFSLNKAATVAAPFEGFNVSDLDSAVLLVKSTAGSGTMTVTLRLWGYSSVSEEWHPLGTNSTDANRGLLNEGTAIGEIVADKLQFAQVIDSLRHFERVYLEITAIGGTATAVSAWLVSRG